VELFEVMISIVCLLMAAMSLLFCHPLLRLAFLLHG
jgi:hypothetical protein